MTWLKDILTEIPRGQNLDSIVLMETGHTNFSTHFLSCICGGLGYAWYCLPSRGRSGGILPGVNC